MLASTAFLPDELALLGDPSVFNRKLSATHKLVSLMERVRQTYLDVVAPQRLLAPQLTDFAKGQIAKGENYEGYPYVMLDFPKYFSGKEKFTFRTMFWFGNYFIFSLILEGEHLPAYRAKFLQNYDALTGKNLHLGKGDLWDWRPDAVQPITLETRNETAHLIQSQSYLKLVHHLPPAMLADESAVLTAAKNFYIAAESITAR